MARPLRLRGSGGRTLLAAGLMALPLSQLGHVIAYVARCQACGTDIGAGIHAYFPNFLLLSGSVVAAGLLGSLLVVGLGRVLVGRGLGLESGAGQPAARLVLVLATVQLEVYLAQETVEMVVAGQALTYAWLLSTLMWGLVGQLPLALVAALAFRWISMRFEVSVRAVRHAWRSLSTRPPAPAGVVVLWPAVVHTPPAARGGPTVLAKRGPPLLRNVC